MKLFYKLSPFASMERDGRTVTFYQNYVLTDLQKPSSLACFSDNGAYIAWPISELKKLAPLEFQTSDPSVSSAVYLSKYHVSV